MGPGTEREEAIQQVLATNVSWLVDYIHAPTKCSQRELINVVHEVMGLVTYLPPRLRASLKDFSEEIEERINNGPSTPLTSATPPLRLKAHTAAFEEAL